MQAPPPPVQGPPGAPAPFPPPGRALSGAPPPPLQHGAPPAAPMAAAPPPQLYSQSYPTVPPGHGHSQPPAPQPQPVAPAPMQAPPAPATAPRRVYPNAFNNVPEQTQTAPAPVPGRSGEVDRNRPSGSSARIDPSQIPRPPSVLGHNPTVFETRGISSGNAPPAATSSYLVKDTGNCSPRNIRSTLSQIPATADLLSSANMPLAVLVQPLALLEPGEEPVQVVDFGEGGPLRCGRCKAYINPFMRFVDGGRRFQCNMCGFVNDCPREYQCNLRPDGLRQDTEARPELCKGSVEFVAPAEYMVRPPMAPAFVFCVETTHLAVSTGATAAVCSSLARTLAAIPGDDRTRVALITFDGSLHFYNLRAASGQPQMCVMGDVEDPYLPMGSGLLVRLGEARDQLAALLNALPGMFAATAMPGGHCAAGAAAKGAVQLLNKCGGKVILFQTSLCTVGLGALKPREGATVPGQAPPPPPDDKAPLKLAGPGEGLAYKKLAQEAADHQVCVDLFLLTQGHVDLASFVLLPRTTAGDVHHYQPFSFSLDTAQLYNDLHWTLVRPQGLEGVMRVRCSTGLSVASCSGAFCKQSTTDLDLPAVDCNKAFLCTLKHDDKLPPDGNEAAVQCALLYTTMTGERRIRVHTLSLPCTNIMGNLFRSADLDTQLHTHVSHAAGQLTTGNVSLGAMKEYVVQRCVHTLFSYRKFCATTSSSGQLILPEALKLLPLYSLAVTKCPMLRTETPADVRVRQLVSFMSLSVSFVVPRLYPRMFAVGDLADRDTRSGLLPTSMALSSDKLDASGIYLCENGLQLMLWVGRQAPASLVQELFGVADQNLVTSASTQVAQGEGAAVSELNLVLNEIRRQRCGFLRVRVAKRGDPLEVAFFNSMVEDRTAGGMSYVEFLCHIHRQIQNKFN